MKKVLISVVGIGLGHATRCEAVARALMASRAEVLITTYGVAYEYFKKQGLPVVKISGHVFGGEKFTFNIMLNILGAIKEPSKFQKDYFVFKKIADDFKPDIIISDSEPNAFFYAYRRSIPNYVISNVISTINNFNKVPLKQRTREISLQSFMLKRLINFMLKRTDLFLVPTFETQIKYGDKIRYIEPIIRVKPKEILSDSELRDKIGVYKDFYYVSVGGSEIEKYLFQFIEKILPLYEDKYFIVSSNYLSKKVVDQKNMKIYPFIENAMEFMKLSKGIITTAGHSTLSEAVVFKKPMLAIPLRKHIEQLVNAYIVSHEGIGETCIFDKEVSQKKLKQAFDNFFKNENNFQTQLNRLTFEGRGAEQIAKIVLEH